MRNDCPHAPQLRAGYIPPGNGGRLVPRIRAARPTVSVAAGAIAGKDGGSLAEAITFPAAVYKVQTLTDSGIRVTLDLPETAIPQMAMLAECQREGIPLLFTAKVDSPQNRKKSGSGKTRSENG